MKVDRVSLTVPKEILEKSDRIAKEKLEDRSTVMRELLNLGLKQYLLQEALKKYTESKISMGKAAEAADVSIWKFLDEMKDRKIPIRYDLDDIKSEIDRIVNKDN
jgi:metal-responsive CopG/Arc/MetJ family transcriptional regulator